MLKKTSRNGGFTLIEVLIAIIILAMGLLGFAALQAVNLKYSQSTYYRSLATQLAYEIADRMRANHGAGNQYLIASTAAGNPLSTGDCATTTGCTAADMAQTDLYDWKQAMSTLPLADGSISLTAGVYTVTISWDDDKDGARDNNLNFVMSFTL